jgi:hypothetical protein
LNWRIQHLTTDAFFMFELYAFNIAGFSFDRYPKKTAMPYPLACAAGWKHVGVIKHCNSSDHFVFAPDPD